LAANFKKKHHIMKKIILSVLSSLTIATSSFGQSLTYDDFKEVIPFLQKEDFKGAYEKTSKLLKSTENDSSDLRGIVTYMNIFSATGMVTLDQMTYEEFEIATKKLIGQYVVMSAHPCIDSSSKGFNSIQFLTNDKGQLEGMTITSNSKKTNILCFEYFDYTDKINPSDMIGKNVRCGGTLNSIEVNPNKSKIWVARLRISNAFARIMALR
jgi:hypothetical protein